MSEKTAVAPLSLDIETLTDIQLDVQESVMKTETDQGVIEKKCICFLVSGYNSQTDKEVDEHIFISIEEAQKIALFLLNDNNNVERKKMLDAFSSI